MPLSLPTLRSPLPRGVFRAPLALLVLAGFGAGAGAQGHHTPAPKASPQGKAPAAPAQNLATVPGLPFVKWTEPKEGAFSVDVPKGWKVEGGLFRVAPTDVRTALQVRSPDDAMTVVMGDPGLPMFLVPTQASQMLGHGEGYGDTYDGLFQRMVMHYMPAPEFNRWYIQKGLSSIIDNITIEGEKNLTEVGEKMTTLANRGTSVTGPRTRVSVGLIWFTGRLKATGKAVSGAVVSTTRLMYSDSPNYIASWTAEPALLGCDANKKDALAQTAANVFFRMKQTFATNPAWGAKENRRVAKIQADHQKRLLASLPKGGGGVYRGGAAPEHTDLMASYWRRNAQRAESQHQFINYLRDEKDIINTDTGQRLTVPDR